jgi:hypothetical protein
VKTGVAGHHKNRLAVRFKLMGRVASSHFLISRSGTADGASAPLVYEAEQTVIRSEEFVTDYGVNINRLDFSGLL